MKVVYVTPELCHRLGTTKRVNPLTTPHVLYGLRRGTLMGLLLIWKLENAELTYWICVYIECGCDLNVSCYRKQFCQTHLVGIIKDLCSAIRCQSTIDINWLFT